MAATNAPSQLTCFSAINRKFQLHRRPIFCPLPSLPACSKIPVVMSVVGGRNADSSSSRIKISRICAADDSKQYTDRPLEPLNTVEDHAQLEKDTTDPGKAYGAAKIHDFCFGIPYGSLVLCGGFVGFLFSRNPAALGSGVLFGGALLALSFLSLKIWRQGKSSIPFVLGQAVLSATLFWKNFQAYSLTNRLVPTGFFTFLSAAMLLFYLYVMISGGNPPPKKLKSSAVSS